MLTVQATVQDALARVERYRKILGLFTEETLVREARLESLEKELAVEQLRRRFLQRHCIGGRVSDAMLDAEILRRRVRRRRSC